jgi:hypothetical protein
MGHQTLERIDVKPAAMRENSTEVLYTSKLSDQIMAQGSHRCRHHVLPVAWWQAGEQVSHWICGGDYRAEIKLGSSAETAAPLTNSFTLLVAQGISSAAHYSHQLAGSGWDGFTFHRRQWYAIGRMIVATGSDIDA